MIAFLFGLLLGGFVGVTFMALFQLNRERYSKHNEESEDKDDE